MHRDPHFPARLHVLLARDAPLAVVIRRGPSKRVATFAWNRSDDTFTLGQWLHGRIYERRCDVSPDGRWLLYFAMDGRPSQKTHGAWTALSQAPWLKAMTLYPKGDCWEGGGLFVDAQRYWVNDRYFDGRATVNTPGAARCDQAFVPERQFGAECTGVYYPRLQRDGWRLCERGGVRLAAYTVFEKTLDGSRVMRKVAHEQIGAPAGKGCYWDEHWLVDGDRALALPDWEWCEIEATRFVWAEHGCLFAAPLSSDDPPRDRVLLRDFRADRFERRAAPY